MRGWLSMLFGPLRWLVAAAAVYLLWQAVVFVRARPEPYTEVETRAVEAACADAVQRLGEAERGAIRVGVVHFGGDSRDAVTGAMRRALAARDGWSVGQGSPITTFLSDVAKALGDATTLDEVLHAGRRVGLDVVVAGRVREVAEERGRGRATLHVMAYDVRAGRWLLREDVSAAWRPGPLSRLVRGVRAWPRLLRLAVWLAWFAALPWVTRFATWRTLERRSNLAGAALLAAYTAADLAAAVLLFKVAPSGFGGWSLVLAALVVCAGYNFWACEQVARD